MANEGQLIPWKNKSNDRGSLLSTVSREIFDAQLPALQIWIDEWRTYYETVVDPNDPTRRKSYQAAKKACAIVRVWIEARINIGPQNFDLSCFSETLGLFQQRFHQNYYRTLVLEIRKLSAFLVSQGRLKHNVIELDLIPKRQPVIRMRTTPSMAYDISMAMEKDTETQLGNAVALLMLANTGLRIAELWDLRSSGFIPRHELLGPHLVLMGKGDRERVVPLTIAFARVLAIYHKRFCSSPASEYFFHKPGDRNRPMSLNIFDRSIRNAVRKLGAKGPPCNSQTVRRGVARELHTRGMRLDLIQRLYDHSDIKDTKVYVGKDESRIFEELNAAHPAFYRQLGAPRRRLRPNLAHLDIASSFNKRARRDKSD